MSTLYEAKWQGETMITESPTPHPDLNGPEGDHIAVIRVSDTVVKQLLGPSIIDQTDTQAMLRDKGVFATLMTALLLPESYTIHALFYRSYRVCELAVESPELPLVSQFEEPPEIILHYVRNEDGQAQLTKMLMQRDGREVDLLAKE